MGVVTICKHGRRHESEGGSKFRAGLLTFEGLMLELGLVFGLAFFIAVVFIIYIVMAKKEEIPNIYYMKNRLPLLKKVQEVNKEIKKIAKAKEEDEVYLR